MSQLKVSKITGLDGNESNAPVKFTGNNIEFNSNTLPPPGSTVQTVVRMVRSPYTYSTGGAYYAYFAEMDAMRTKIKSRYDNSAFFVSMWLNGEAGNTHDWTWAPARSFVDVAFSENGWHTEFFTHNPGIGGLGTQWRWYLGAGYTNPGQYGESDYSSTPGDTQHLHFIDAPSQPAGTNIWYTNFMMSTGNHTWYLNRPVSYTQSSHETGVSGVRIEEIAGPVVRTEIEDGIEEYHFGDEHITGDRTSANSSMTGLTSEKEIIYPSRNS